MVLSRLSLSEVLKCVLVCKKWRDGILHQHTYWSGQMQSIGMSPRSVSESVRLFPSHRDCYFAVRRHQHGAQAMELVCSMATCYPKILTGSSFFMERLDIVAMTERVEGDIYLRVVEILSGGVVTVRDLCRIQLSSDLSAARWWVHYSRGSGCVYWTDSSGCCWGCKPSLQDEQPVQFRESDAVSCDAMASGMTGVSTTEKSEILHVSPPNIKANLDGDGDWLLAGCDTCSTLLACRSECDSAGRGITELTFSVFCFGSVETLDPAVTLPQRIQHTSTCHFGEPLKLEVQGSAQAPSSQQTTCPLHYALIQGKEATIIAFLTKQDGQSSVEMKCECLRCSHHLPGMGLTVISPCDTLIGCFTHDSRLHVWEVETEANTLRLFSNTSEVLVGGQGSEGKRLELVALGHHLSIVREGSAGDSAQGLLTGSNTIYIIHTESGNVLQSVSLSQGLSSVPPPPQLPPSPSPDPPIYLLSKEGRQWLCDLSCPSPHTLLTVVSTTGGNGTVRFLLLRQPPSTGHYVQAINYVFQN